MAAPSSSVVSHPADQPAAQSLNFGRRVILGGIAGICGSTSVFPMDVVKTRLQSQRPLPDGTMPYKGIGDAFGKLYRGNGGFFGMYNGLIAQLVGITPEKAIKLAANDFYRSVLPKNAHGELDLHMEMVAGGLAGLSQVVATNPMEIVKIRMQVMKRAASEVRSKLCLRFALPSFQRELGWGVLGAEGAWCAWSVQGHRQHAAARRSLQHYLFPAVCASEEGNRGRQRAQQRGAAVRVWRIGWFVRGGSGLYDIELTFCACLGFVAATLSTPMDVVKTRMQMKDSPYTGIVDCVRRTVSQEVCFVVRPCGLFVVLIPRAQGGKALWRGVGPRMLIISPLFGITLLVYEQLQALAHRLLD
jgi:hypothetical protein